MHAKWNDGYLAKSYDAIDIIQYVNTVKSLCVYKA